MKAESIQKNKYLTNKKQQENEKKNEIKDKKGKDKKQ